jgi:SAM-dependent methyltransferase
MRQNMLEEHRAPAAPLAEASPVGATAALEECLNRVEYYQPLYGISGFEDPLRACRDRAVAIAAALSPARKNFRLVDFGSSLGYFPFFFADRGALTTGLDLDPKNTAVALATQQLNGLNAAFDTASLTLDLVRVIQPGEFDVALLLSVLHHITHKRGVDHVAEILAEMLDRIPTLVLELAHRNEPVPYAWRKSLPDDPLEILRACGNVIVKPMGHFPSHLSSVTRPMYLVTR